MPLQSNLEDLKEKLVGVSTAAHLVGLEDHRAMLAASRRRTREGHEAGAKAMGFDPTPISGEDEMGDLIVTGDIEMRGQGTPESQARLANGGVAKAIGTAALGAAIPLAALAGYYMANLPERGNTPVVSDFNDNINTIRPDDQP